MGSVRGKAPGKFVVFQAIQQEVAKLFCFSAWKKTLVCLTFIYVSSMKLRLLYANIMLKKQKFTRRLRWFSVVFSEIWKPER